MLKRHFQPVYHLLLVLCLLSGAKLSAAPLERSEVPQALQGWVDWALHGETELTCPWYYNRSQRACQWPATLKLTLHERGGSFRQQWQVFNDSYVRLPGDGSHWPQQVSNAAGKALLIEERDGFPAVKLSSGTHTLNGSFHWSKLPRALSITPSAALISLSVNEQAIENPRFNQQGQLWLTQSKTQSTTQDNLDIQVFRKIVDSHPIQVVTVIKMRVSGKQRNANLTPVLLPDFIPFQLKSPLPARMIEQQQLQVQLRPGEWTLEVVGRAANNQTTFTLPSSTAPWPQQEIWVLQADSRMRQVEVNGMSSIDPNQTRLPADWKALPAYLMTPQDTLTLKVIRRGAAQTGRQELSLQREMWLDFDGKGYTLKDQLSGNVQQQSRLEVLPALALGRVSVDGQPQFITRSQADSPPGVELRSEQLDLQAESRYQGAINTPLVNGWQHDLQHINTTLHLPPGWRLFAVSGTDNQPQSWVQRWSLLDLFLVLVIALATHYLFGWRWGTLALLALVFTWHENGAPQYLWLNLLAALALLRVLPTSTLKRAVTSYYWLGLATLALIVLPYLMDTVRVALYPQLGYTHSNTTHPQNAEFAQEAFNTVGLADDAQPQRAQIAEAMVQQAPLPRMSKKLSNSIKPAPKPQANQHGRQYDMKAIDPDSMIQTGPGLPHWRMNQHIHLHWAGPVKADERSQLWLINPRLNLLLQLIGLLLLLVLSGRMLMHNKQPPQHPKANVKPTAAPSSRQGTASSLLALLLLPLLLCNQPEVHATALPDAQMLQTLRDRLTAEPDCQPSCAQIERMSINLSGNTLSARLTVHAATDTAIPLPGSQDTWLAQNIRLNHVQATALQRDPQQRLWLAVPAGQHEIHLRGPLSKRNSVTLPLPLKPHFVSWHSNDASWTLDGIRDSGVPEAQLRINRVLTDDAARQQEQEQNILPTFIKIERRLHLGLDWHVETTVRRLAPLNTPLSLNIPLLPGEQPMSDRLRVSQQQIKINLGAQQMTAHWSSRLTPGSEIVLQAANNPDYLESWYLATSPVWHVQSSSLVVNQFTQQDGQRIPVWLPWPGEKLILRITRPQGVPGQTVTLLASQLTVQPGKRANDVTLDLNFRSSRGVQHSIELPDTADVQALHIDGSPQRIQPKDQQRNILKLTLKPGQQQVTVQWREHDAMGWLYTLPAVKPGLPGVNARLQIAPSAERWTLWTHGPTLGPAVLFWGVLAALVVVALLLGYSKLTPLKSWQWFLLGIGLSQTEPLLMILVAGWLIALAQRGNRHEHIQALAWWQFNLLQLALAGLTLLALLILAVGLSHGLLGQPEMQIAGNGSSAYNLSWYQDHSMDTLPQPLVVSVPLWLYRVLMLLWALWLALAVLRWLSWGWQALNQGGLWRPRPKKQPKKAAPQT